MNFTPIRSLRLFGATLIAGLLTSSVFAQGSLTPPAGTPGPTQKTLQQIWDKIDALETQARELQDQVGTLQNDNAALGLLLDNAGVALPWRNTVATNTLVQISLTATNNLYWAGSLSLAITPRGSPAISWQDGQFNGYAAEEGARWKTTRWPMDEPVGGGWKRFQFVSGALGFMPSGQPVMAGFEAFQGTATNLVLKTLSGAATNLVSTLSSADAFFPQLVLSAKGLPEISYMKGFPPTASTLRILQRVGSGWTDSTVATNTLNRLHSMAVSSDGQTGIAYLEKGTDDLRLAYRTGATFTNALVTAEAIFSHSLAFSSTGAVTVAYLAWDGGGIALRLATLSEGTGGFETGVWNIESIETGQPGTGWRGNVSLAFGPNGRPAIAYSDPEMGVRYATQSSSGAWSISQVAPPKSSPDQIPFDSVLRFTRSGYPVIAYWDERTATIRVATRAPFVAP